MATYEVVDRSNKGAVSLNNNPLASNENFASSTPNSPLRVTADSTSVFVHQRRSDSFEPRGSVLVSLSTAHAVTGKSPKMESVSVTSKKSFKNNPVVKLRHKHSDVAMAVAAAPTGPASDSEESVDDDSGDSEHRSVDSQSFDSRSTGGGVGQDPRNSVRANNNMPSATSAAAGPQTPGAVVVTQQRSTQGRRSRRRPVSEEWEIMEGLRSGQQFDLAPPAKFGGYIMKSRKWPMKGWHKRYFYLENGILTYSKTSGDLEKGRFHGTVDTGLSVIAYKKKGRRIDVDADDLIYHLKVKSSTQYEEWVKQLKQHRLYRQHELTYGTKEAPKLVDVTTPVDDYSPIHTPLTPDSPVPFEKHGSFKCRSLDRSQNRVAAWLIDSHGAQAWNKELTSIQSKIFELGTTLEQLQSISRSSVSGSCTNVTEPLQLPDPTSISPTTKTGKIKKYSLAKTMNKTKERKSKDRLSVANGLPSIHLSTSNPNLLAMDMVDHGTGNTVLISTLPVEGVNSAEKLQEQFYNQAKSVHETLKTVCRMITTERERLKRALEQDTVPTGAAYVQSLKQTLAEALKQNADYRNRLAHIHNESSISDLKPIVSPLITGAAFLASGPPSERDHPRLAASESMGSQTEFYDAEERLNTSSDESEEEEVEDEDISDTENTAVPASEDGHDQLVHFQIRRRSKLPAPQAESDVSVWSLLCKNIGKDLSKISMPVSMNEPLNALQRLCEELEYSELLDRVADVDDPYERMVWIAAFCVSGYSSTYTRAGQKPFNPVLGETYECVREDKGWKFIAEQVSHHPPVSACHSESKNFIFWQDMQVKTKFWGKSMEVQPIGLVNLKLFKHKEHYTWNKATSCVHNLLGGQRWVDHYGEVIITNHTLQITCKLTFVKSSYWSAKKHEVYGTVQNTDGKTVHRLCGKWNEGLYYGDTQTAKCIWRPGSLPPECEIYYGFTRFAIELNEVDEEQVHLYPPTDTRFRPDQRMLEEGRLSDAEAEKQRIEQMQREQRKQREEEGQSYNPRWFMLEDQDNKKETYVYNGKYWDTRRDPGFMNLSFPRLW